MALRRFLLEVLLDKAVQAAVHMIKSPQRRKMLVIPKGTSWMTDGEVQCANADHEASAINTIVLGFAADPMTRWVWPDASDYLKTMPRFIRAFGGAAFESGTAYITEGVRAAALWLPPNVEPDHAMGAIMEESLRPEIAEDLGSIVKSMAETPS